jgi:hypothetical protein
VASRQREPELAAAHIPGLTKRIRFLINHLGFKDLEVQRPIYAWTDQLASKPDASRTELLEATRKLSRAVERDEGQIGGWNRPPLARQKSILASQDTVDSLRPDSLEPELETQMELRPLFTDWL